MHAKLDAYRVSLPPIEDANAHSLLLDLHVSTNFKMLLTIGIITEDSFLFAIPGKSVTCFYVSVTKFS
jgi:hypothetical protein